MKSFLLQFTSIKEESLFGHIFWETEISHFASGAYCSIMTDRCFDESKVALHFLDVSSDFQYDVFSNGNGVTITHGKMGGLSGGLQLPVYQPSTHFIHQCGLDTSMKSVQPTLEIGMWLPKANDVIAIFVKFHFQAKRIARAASKTIVSLFFQAYIRVLYLFHLYRFWM